MHRIYLILRFGLILHFQCNNNVNVSVRIRLSGVVGRLVVIEPTPASENLPIMPTDAWLLHNSNKFDNINEKTLDTSDNLFTSNYVQNQSVEAINIYCQSSRPCKL